MTTPTTSHYAMALPLTIATALLTACASTPPPLPETQTSVRGTIGQQQFTETNPLPELEQKIDVLSDQIASMSMPPLNVTVADLINHVDGELAVPVFGRSSPMIRVMTDRLFRGTKHRSIRPFLSQKDYCQEMTKVIDGRAAFYLIGTVSGYDNEGSRTQSGPVLTGDVGGSSMEAEMGDQKTTHKAEITLELRSCGTGAGSSLTDEFRWTEEVTDQGVYLFGKIGGVVWRRMAKSDEGHNTALRIATTSLFLKLMEEQASEMSAAMVRQQRAALTPAPRRLNYAAPLYAAPTATTANAHAIAPRASYINRPARAYSPQIPRIEPKIYDYANRYAHILPKETVDEVIVTDRRTSLRKSSYFPKSMKRDFRCDSSGRSCDMSFQLPRRGTLVDMETYMMRAARAAGAAEPVTTCEETSRRGNEVRCATSGVRNIEWREWREQLFSSQ